MTVTILIAALALLGALALATAIGAARIARQHGPAGRFVDVAGGRLHIVELSPPQPLAADDIPIVVIHGASGNLEEMRYALGDQLAERWRVILIDRPGRGASDRPGGRAASSPSRQAALVRDVLDRLGIPRAIILAHSWGGARATALAVDHPDRVAGLVLLGPVTHPWPGGIAWYYRVASTPFVGWVFARTFALPFGSLLLDGMVVSVFAPQPVPPNYVARASIRLVLRAAPFLANAQDVADLKRYVAAKMSRYGEIKAPTVIIAGDCDETVSPKIHAQALAAMLPDARLEMLPGVGHMVHYAAPDRVVAAVAEVEARIKAARGVR
jgi:pimeloyl-ACP methyl ester carboxylesterase